MAHGLPLFSEGAPQKGEKYVLGIDEAGRGPILGPMVYGASWTPLKDYDAFGKIGFMDSKQIKAERREELFEIIRSEESDPQDKSDESDPKNTKNNKNNKKGKKEKEVQIEYKVTVISAEEISNKMQSIAKINLNLISHNAAIDLIRFAIDCGFDIAEVYVDTVGKPEPYERKLNYLFPDIKCVVSEKADSRFPIVSAASICAKVIRDKEMEYHQHPEPGITDVDFGSGYLADPSTGKWIVRNIDKIFGFPSVTRFSWKPTKLAMEKGSVPVKWCRYGEDDDDEIQDSAQGRLSFATRFRFFTENDIETVEDFFS